MELDWDKTILPETLITSKNFLTSVRTTLRTEWKPPDGLILDYDTWYKNYLMWHAHLIPISDFDISLDEAIRLKGLPHYSPTENPEAVSEQWKPIIERDIKDRENLIRKAKNRYDIRWYILLHGCYFNASTIWIAMNYLYPKLKWRALESKGHVLITTGTTKQVYDYLFENGSSDFYIAEPIVKGKDQIKDLMKSDLDWKEYDDVYVYYTKVYNEFFIGY